MGYFQVHRHRGWFVEDQTQTLFLSNGSLQVHINRVWFGEDLDLLPPWLFLLFLCVNIFSVPPTGRLTSKPKQRLIWGRSTFTEISTVIYFLMNINSCSNPMRPTDKCTGSFFCSYSPTLSSVSSGSAPPFEINTNAETYDQELGYLVERFCTGSFFCSNSPMLWETNAGSFPLSESTWRQETVIESSATQVE